jgi:hypothetical protein
VKHGARIEPVNNPPSGDLEIGGFTQEHGKRACKQLALVGGRYPAFKHLIARDLDLERGEHQGEKLFQTLAIIAVHVERPILIEIVIGRSFKAHGEGVEVMGEHFHEKVARTRVRAPGAKLLVDPRHYSIGIDPNFAQQEGIERR